MDDIRQFLHVTALSLRSLRQRIKGSLVVVLAMAFVIGGIMPFFTLAGSIYRSYGEGGDPGRAIVLSAGAQLDHQSAIAPALLPYIFGAPGVARADAELVMPVSLPKNYPGNGGTVIRGMGPDGFAISPEMRLISGRFPRPGSREVIAGIMTTRKFIGLEQGHDVTFLAKPPAYGRAFDAPWRIVGIFQTGSTLDGNFVADAGALKNAMRSFNYNFVLVRLTAPDALAPFQKAVEKKPALKVMRQTEYYRRMIAQVPLTVVILGYAVGLVFGMGVLAAVANTMYGAVSARRQEIVILRALGFDGMAVAASVVFEAMALAMLGAILGFVPTLIWLNGYPYNGGLQGGVFRVEVTGHEWMIGMGWAFAIAIPGALIPAVRTARMRVAEAAQRL